ncbi:MAG: MaoC family dehydratase [Bacteroidota bacterium]
MQFENITDFKKKEGQDLPPSQWLTVTQKMVDDFSAATQDYQWIHTDVERAKKESPFGGTIAHGFFSVSMLSKFIMDNVDVKSAKMGVNYGLEKVRFPHPVPVGSDIRLLTKVAKITDYGERGIKIFWDCTLEIKNVEKPACVGTFISLLFE